MLCDGVAPLLREVLDLRLLDEGGPLAHRRVPVLQDFGAPLPPVLGVPHRRAVVERERRAVVARVGREFGRRLEERGELRGRVGGPRGPGRERESQEGDSGRHERVRSVNSWVTRRTPNASMSDFVAAARVKRNAGGGRDVKRWMLLAGLVLPVAALADDRAPAPLPPAKAVASMVVPDGFRATLVAA